MSPPRLALPILLTLLAIDGIIEVGFIGSMVGFLHDRAGRFFTISYASSAGPTFNLHGKPAGIMVDQGHTSNGAAGTAVVLISFGGFLTLWYERRRNRRSSSSNTTSTSGLFKFWTVLTILSFLLTLGALIYTFILTAQTNDQTIDLAVAAANPDPLMYPLDDWTPENWFSAVLRLSLVHDSDRRDIRNHLRLMRAWRWNLIPLLVLGLAVMVVAVATVLFGGRGGSAAGGGGGGGGASWGGWSRVPWGSRSGRPRRTPSGKEGTFGKRFGQRASNES